MKASIVTPSYNSLKYLKYTLAALERQDFGFENFEVVVIDDASSDGTSEFLRTYKENINLIPVINPINLGRAKSRNVGIKHASNELIIFLDSDIEVKPDFISLHLKKHQNQNIACVGKVDFNPGLKKDKFMKYLDSRGAAKFSSGEKIPGQYFRTTNASVRKKLLYEISLFDENFTHYGGEDTEIGMRISDKVPIIMLSEAIGYNRHVRGLNATLDIIQEFGQYSLPYLLEKRPELTIELKMKKGYSGLFYKFICLPIFYYPLKLLADLNIVPSIIYSYLLMRNYRKGFKEVKSL